MKSACGTLKKVRADFKRAVREAVRLSNRGLTGAAENTIKRAHAKVYWCARQEGYANVSHWQARYRRRRR
jgi:hypothetical protein